MTFGNHQVDIHETIILHEKLYICSNNNEIKKVLKAIRTVWAQCLIYDLLNDTVTSSVYIVLSDTIICE